VTETYAALKLSSDKLALGGCAVLPAHRPNHSREQLAICIRFKNPPQDLLKHARLGSQHPNWVMLRHQPTTV